MLFCNHGGAWLSTYHVYRRQTHANIHPHTYICTEVPITRCINWKVWRYSSEDTDKYSPFIYTDEGCVMQREREKKKCHKAREQHQKTWSNNRGLFFFPIFIKFNMIYYFCLMRKDWKIGNANTVKRIRIRWSRVDAIITHALAAFRVPILSYTLYFMIMFVLNPTTIMSSTMLSPNGSF